MPRIKNKLTPTRRFFNKRIVSALILILISCVIFWVGWQKIDNVVTEACYVMLRDYATQIAADLSSDLKHDIERLEAYAEVLSQYESLEGPGPRFMLDAYQRNSTVSRLGVLLPDDRILLADNKSWDSGLRFEEESQAAPLLTKQKDYDTGQSYISQSAPIKRNGQTVGVLYEFTDARAVVSGFERYGYPSNTELCVIDSTTGDYVLDTGTAKNIFSDENRKPDNPEAIKENFASKKPGYAVLRGKSHTGAMHAYYIPAEIDGWMIMLAFSQEALFDSAAKTRRVMNCILIAELALFLVYLFWLLLQNRRYKSLKERQIFQMEGLIYIQEALFDAHKTPGRVESALGKTANMIAAKSTFLIPTENNPGGKLYVWPASTDKSGLDWQVIKSTLPHITEQLYSGYSVLADSGKSLHHDASQESKELKARKLKSLILVPIFDAEQRLIRVLGSANVKRSQDNVDLLEAVAHVFMMALENIHSYRIIEKMGTTDALTGLLNRNSFQRALDERNDVFGCVYLDANGLHDINNEKGHAAGDAMLSTVASALKNEFGSDCTYRIGGDEFVALTGPLDPSAIEEKIKRIAENVNAKGYFISSGYSCSENPAATPEEKNALVTKAEQLMYKDKRSYYESLGNGSKPRNLPKLE